MCAIACFQYKSITFYNICGVYKFVIISRHQMYNVGGYSIRSDHQLYSYSTEDTVRIVNSFITILNHT
jgi:hypothetical protein